MWWATPVLYCLLFSPVLRDARFVRTSVRVREKHAWVTVIVSFFVFFSPLGVSNCASSGHAWGVIR